MKLPLLRLRVESDQRCRADATLASAQPEQHLMPAPSNLPAMESLLLGEALEKRQRFKDPTGAARETGHLMGGQERLAGRKTFIYPSGDRPVPTLIGGEPISD